MINMRIIEKQRKMGRSAKNIRGTGVKNPVTKVMYSDSMGATVTCIEQETIVPACVWSNLQGQLRAIPASFLQEPLFSYISYQAEVEGADKILDGCFVPPHSTDKYSCELICEMKMPEKIRLIGLIDVTVTPANHHSFWWRQQATVSCDSSHLSFAHYKN